MVQFLVYFLCNLGMVIVGNEFETKEKKFQPRMDSFTT